MRQFLFLSLLRSDPMSVDLSFFVSPITIPLRSRPRKWYLDDIGSIFDPIERETDCKSLGGSFLYVLTDYQFTVTAYNWAIAYLVSMSI
ncbi:hypothetical protein ISN45_Aa01g012980 [Arabidopsis thaliana x Arabidopsis arenosa]|uniref:Uncharacterized protein n=1 Tax=Arabidopsis thaliana x Arabidopsis arenosa TaxID=1240361 RepID=A0A8T2BYD2_9BRAS|nr:hypothetical protein ISN45_Aa01g012980 [Arabidopsis thaliana x Arabidopsis arenosa]